MNLTKWQAGERLQVHLMTAGHECLLVGGAVRDLHMGVDTDAIDDLDFATTASPVQVASIFGEHNVNLTNQDNKAGNAKPVAIVSYEGHAFEVAQYRQDGVDRRDAATPAQSFETDAARRDFTFNAIGMNMITGRTFDPVNGLDDLRNGIVRAVGNPCQRFQEDADRVYRAVMFAARYNFTIERETERGMALARVSGLVEANPRPRVGKILNKMLAHRSRVNAITMLENHGLLRIAIPELAAQRYVDQPAKYHAEGCVLCHSIESMGSLPVDEHVENVWAVLLHDIGKGASVTDPRFAENFTNRVQSGKLTFYGHDVVGAEIADRILTEFSLPGRENIVGAIREHMNIRHVADSRSLRLRLFNAPYADMLIILSRADANGSLTRLDDGTIVPNMKGQGDIERLYEEHLNAPPEVQKPCIKRDLGLDGHYLMHLGFQGKQIGFAISVMQSAYENNPTMGRNDLLLLVAGEGVA